ncbi:MAG: hypothetical protein HUK24_09320, partial [Sphaerochaetaceae bacterium]|nr:hypothetical protein [Sphaerochaetaceae bacterium]
MKKYIFCIFFSSVLLLSLAANDLIGRGSGITEEDAKISARENLAQSIQTSIISTNITTSLDYTLFFGNNSFSSSSSTMYTQAYSLSNVEFFGLKESVTKQGSSYEAICTIPVTSISVYKVALDDIIESININYLDIDTKIADKDLSNEYLNLLGLLTKYETYRIILLLLQPDIQLSKPMVSRTYIEAEYQVYLQQQINLDEATFQNLQYQTELNIITMEGKKALEEAKKRIEENQKKRDELILQRNEQLQLDSIRFEQELQVNLSLMKQKYYIDNEQIINTSNFNDLVGQLDSLRLTLKELKEQTSNSLDSIMDEMTEEITKTTYDIQNREYLEFELDNGVVKSYAKKMRDDEVLENEENIRVLYKGYAINYFENMASNIVKIQDKAKSLLKDLNGKAFTVNSLQPEVSYSIEGFSFEDYSFYGTIIVNFGYQIEKIPFEFSYYELTKDKIPSKLSVSKYNEIKYKIDNWYQLFMSTKEALFVEVDYRCIESLKESKYDVSYSAKILRSDTGSLLFSSNKKTVEVDSLNLLEELLPYNVDSNNWFFEGLYYDSINGKLIPKLYKASPYYVNEVGLVVYPRVLVDIDNL